MAFSVNFKNLSWIEMSQVSRRGTGCFFNTLSVVFLLCMVLILQKKATTKEDNFHSCCYTNKNLIIIDKRILKINFPNFKEYIKNFLKLYIYRHRKRMIKMSLDKKMKARKKKETFLKILSI